MIKIIKNKYNLIPIAVKASILFLLCSFLQRAMSAITTPIFTRIMSPEAYGQYSIFSAWQSIISDVISLRIYGGVFAQGLVKFDKDRDIFASSAQGLGITLTIIWTCIYLFFREFFNNLFGINTTQMLLMLCIIGLNTAYGLWALEQRTELRYKRLVIVTSLYTIFSPLLGIVLVCNMTDKVTGRILGAAIASLVYLFCFFSQLYKGKRFFSFSYWKYIVWFNVPLLPHYISNSILSGADRIMIGKMADEWSAGIYNLGYSISLIMTMFNTALLQTIEPWLYKKIKNKDFISICEVAYPSFIAIASLNILLIIFAPEVVRFFAPKEYYDAVWIISPVAMSTYFMFLYSFFATFEFYYEKRYYISVSTMLGALANIILNYFSIKMFGYIAAAYTTLFCYITYAFLHYWFMNKICKTQLDGIKIYDRKKIFGISICFVVIGLFFTTCYELIILRYSLLFIAVLIAICYRKKIYNLINIFLKIRKGE